MCCVNKTNVIKEVLRKSRVIGTNLRDRCFFTHEEKMRESFPNKEDREKDGRGRSTHAGLVLLRAALSERPWPPRLHKTLAHTSLCGFSLLINYEQSVLIP